MDEGIEIKILIPLKLEKNFVWQNEENKIQSEDKEFPKTTSGLKRNICNPAFSGNKSEYTVC